MQNLKPNIILLLFLVICSFISCEERVDNKKNYEINGTIENIPENTMVYIQYDDFLDSTIIRGNRFKFTGEVKETERTRIYLKKVRKKIRFWLDNSIINIKTNDNLTENIILGGKAQEMANIHTSKNATIHNKIDSIDNIFKIRKKELTTNDRNLLISKINEFAKESKENSKLFIKEYPNSYESIYVLNANKSIWNKKTVKSLFSLMNMEIQETEYGKSVARYLELNKNPAIGEKYIDFKQQNILGQEVKFSDLKGKYTLIEFWASWCGPCRESYPKLKGIYKKYNNDGFEIVGVSLDENRDNWIKAINKDELNWNNVTDLMGNENEAVILYNVIGIPDNLLIDDKGIIIERNVTLENLKNQLETIF